LDHDDRVGGTGAAENIYWPSNGAPNGTYQVDVVLFSSNGFSGNVSYRVLVQNENEVSSYTGTLTTDDERQHVVTFVLGQ